MKRAYICQRQTQLWCFFSKDQNHWAQTDTSLWDRSRSGIMKGVLGGERVGSYWLNHFLIVQQERQVEWGDMPVLERCLNTYSWIRKNLHKVTQPYYCRARKRTRSSCSLSRVNPYSPGRLGLSLKVPGVWGWRGGILNDYLAPRNAYTLFLLLRSWTLAPLTVTLFALGLYWIRSWLPLWTSCPRHPHCEFCCGQWKVRS